CGGSSDGTYSAWPRLLSPVSGTCPWRLSYHLSCCMTKERALAKARHVAFGAQFDVACEREPDMAWQRQRRRRCAMVQNHAATRARLIDIRVLRKVPVRVINLQQVMEHIADEQRGAAF